MKRLGRAADKPPQRPPAAAPGAPGPTLRADRPRAPAVPLVRLVPLARQLIVREWRHHPWRHALALAAVALGVALAWSVHLINSSALAEFAGAVRSAGGAPDLVLRGPESGLDERLFERAAGDAAVEAASPVIEVETYARTAGGMPLRLRVVGVDALRVGTLAAALQPRPAAGVPPLAVLDPTRAFVNAPLRERLGGGGALDRLELRAGAGWQGLEVAGDIAAGGAPLAVVDLAAAQTLFGMTGRLSRVDLRLAPGADRQALLARLALPAGVAALPPDESAERVESFSRAYRVNLTALALVALFVGAFLVYSVLSLAVAQRTPMFALLGVLGLTAHERRALVLAECTLLGALGSALGLVLGSALAAAALRWLAGALGGGFFPGIAPTWHWSSAGAARFALLGTASALVGGWRPARAAEALAPAQALKGLGGAAGTPRAPWLPLALLALGVLLAYLPPLAGLPLAAYGAVAALLLGGVALVPAVVEAMLAFAPAPRRALPLLAWRRARWQRATATAAVAGVVSSLALCVAITVMVASLRTAIAQWLDVVLPADLYARSAGSAAAAENAWLAPDIAARAAALPGVARVQATRVRALQLAPGRPAVTLLARPLPDPAAALPLRAPPLPPRPGLPGVFVSEAAAMLYGARPGSTLRLPLASATGRTAPGALGGVEVYVRGVWRDFARQFGAVAIDAAEYRALTGDTRVNDLALWLTNGAAPDPVAAGLRALLPDATLLDIVSTHELRRLSLHLFDRSFAVTYYLQAVAIAVGLVGVGASLGAQVLARRKEFGLLAHLGLTRRQVLALVCGEASAWLAAGTLVGLALGVGLSLVLVFVVNPQSFHWTMDLVLPWARLAALAAAVTATGLAASALAARGAIGHSVLRSVREDW
ncbi:MAG: permease [Pseudomonadota bacterium]